MNINNKIVLFALLGIFLIAGSASAAVDFPADEAGISAYVKAKSSIDLNTTKSALASIERETSEYVIGTVALTYHKEEEYPHVYVSTDGWIVAYYPKSRPSSWLFPWADYNGGALSSTTLSKAIGIVATAVGGQSPGIKYYDFRYPNASKMMFILESTTGTEFFKVTIPTAFSTYVVDYSHYENTVGCGYNCYGSSSVYLDGGVNPFSTFGQGLTYSYGSLLGQFTNGVEHEVKILAYSGTGRIGLVLEYAE